jgi:hypothetical protein
MPKEAVVLCLPEVTEENNLPAQIQTWQSQSTSLVRPVCFVPPTEGENLIDVC